MTFTFPVERAPNILGLEGFASGHLRSYGYSLPLPIRNRHLARIQSWGKELEQWAQTNHTNISVDPKPLGDPHEPDGSRAAQISMGSTRTKCIWKPGVDRYRIEHACQNILQLLGPESFILPITGFELGSGGAWRKIRLHGKRPPTREVLGRAFACMLFLSACFNLPDVHFENVVWDGKGFRLIDTEFFSGPTLGIRNSTWPRGRMERVAERVDWSWLLSALWDFRGSKGLRDRAAVDVIDQLDWALDRFRAVWPQMMEIRRGITGLKARTLFRGTGELYSLIPFALSATYRENTYKELQANVPPFFDREQAFKELLNACVPIQRNPIPVDDDPYDGVIEPDETMRDVIRALLMAGPRSIATEEPSLEEILVDLRVKDVRNPSTPVGYGSLTTGGINENPAWNDPGFCHGLGGIVLLHAAENLLGLPHQLLSSSEVVETHPGRLKEHPPVPGMNLGLGGEFMLGWGLHRLNALPTVLCKVCDDRLEYLGLTEARPMDLAMGLCGNLLGLVRAAEYLEHRRGDIRLMAQRLVDRIQEEFLDLVKSEPSVRQKISLGFAHGLAGAVLSIHQARHSLGIAAPELKAMIEELALQTQSEKRLNELKSQRVFCYSLDGGITAVLRHVRGEDASWASRHTALPPLTRRLARQNLDGSPCDTDSYLSNSCCGAGAYHLGRISPMPMKVPNLVCHRNSAFGYFGSIGFHYINLSRYGTFFDPVWGREILTFPEV